MPTTITSKRRNLRSQLSRKAKQITSAMDRVCKACGRAYKHEKNQTCSPACAAAHLRKHGLRQKQRAIDAMAAKNKEAAASAFENRKPRSVEEALMLYGHDEDFEPDATRGEFLPAIGGPGSPEKIEALRKRVELGLPLWHDDDPVVCERVCNNNPGALKLGGVGVVGNCGRFGARAGGGAKTIFTSHRKRLGE